MRVHAVVLDDVETDIECMVMFLAVQSGGQTAYNVMSVILDTHLEVYRTRRHILLG